MLKNSIHLIGLLYGFLAYGQFECPTINSPLDGDIDVPVEVSIAWSEVDGTNGYLISLGTTPGGTDIVDNRPVSSASFTPELGLPENTGIYVTITLFFFNQDNIVCQSEMFRTVDVTTPPSCTTVNNPTDGSIEVGTNTSISWDYAPTATGYTLSLGTSPGSGDILNDFEIVDALSYEPAVDLPFETEIFVQIIPFNDNGPTGQACQEYSFTTEEELLLPGCTSLSSPIDGEVNVPLTPLLEWEAVPGADGYRISIGTTATENDIVDNGAYSNNATEVIDFLPNRTYYVTITPFNRAGDALGCSQTSFTTILGCGPVEDPVSGELVSFGPNIEFPGEVALCLNEIPTIITSQNLADGHRWFKINDDGTETLLSETIDLSLFEEGQYRYEAYNLVTQLGDVFECAESKVFYASSSELPNIKTIDVIEQNGVLEISIKVDGIGAYEFAINSIEGPYQQNNRFSGIAEGTHTIYIRDLNGCGIVQERVSKGLTREGFPIFFTPNGDGINDFWQFDPPQESAKEVVDVIYIFDRYGILVKQIGPDSKGWDGSKDGFPLPSADYWYKAVSNDNKKVVGHFTLKR